MLVLKNERRTKMSNSGRPKKEGLDKVIKVTVNDEVAEMLDDTAQEIGKSKSDILRELIPIVSSKDYEGLIPNTSMEILQKYSEKCWDILHTPGCIFEVDKLSDNMPAFVVTMGEPVVYVKYPTFKIEIFDSKNPLGDTSQKDIEELLKDVYNRSYVSYNKADYLVIGGRLEKMQFPYVNEVTCLEVILEKNVICKDKIVEILKNNNYNVSVYPSYCIRRAEVELLEENKYFRVISPE